MRPSWPRSALDFAWSVLTHAFLAFTCRYAMQGYRRFPSPGGDSHARLATHLSPTFKLVHSNQRRQVATTEGAGACVLYSSPSVGDTLPVLEDVTLTWNPCIDMKTSTVDLYLSVQSDAGLTAVHLWQHVPYQNSSLTTQLNPGWWNASTGAGSVMAQVSCMASVVNFRFSVG